jgi:chemotaxis family two-component system sensor kinase Cph1
MNAALTLATVNLENCDKEPIHIPGLVQPHGVLLAVDTAGSLTHASRNARELFPALPEPGSPLLPGHLGDSGPLQAALALVRREATSAEDAAPLALEWTSPVDGSLFDVVLHAFLGRVVIEFEHRGPRHEDLASFALLAHRSMGRLRNRRAVGAMLEEAVATVRELTGFDRVMAYRFHEDDSGEVVAESRVDALDPYLGRRFPASDIPAQARRLYLINTLRLIADVRDEQVPVDAAPHDRTPLDLSHSVLRSVSPIHIEYLKNINVAASMSMSIVVNGRLWGLIACHHRTAHRVPYAIRMACDVLSQMVSSSVQTGLERVNAARRSQAADVRSRLVDVILNGDDVLGSLGDLGRLMQPVIAHDGVVFAHAGKIVADSTLTSDAIGVLMRWLDELPDDLVAIDACPALPPPVAEAIAPYCGVLALRFDPVNHGHIVFLRREQVETITWSGPPDKAGRIGPLGARLTPGGSFAEWRQVVEGTSAPWDAHGLEIARQLLDELGRATSARGAEMERARARLLAVLGHDLRDPLQTISMAARLIEHGDPGSRVSQRINSSTGRMDRMITQVLDMSRLHGGLGLGLRLVTCDVAALVRNILEDMAVAHPRFVIHATLPPSLMATADPDRLAQVASNLLSNARHHGAVGKPLSVRLLSVDGFVEFAVSNHAAPIPEASARILFQPLKERSVGNERNPSGLGLGLYIASEIVKGHQGSLRYGHADEQVTFTVRFPQDLAPTPA